MTGTNHIVTGAVIALAVKQPVLSVVLAFCSHFVLDALPHFGFSSWQERQKHKNLFNTVVWFDCIAALITILLLVINGAPGLVYAAGLAAYAPDLVWVYRFIIRERMGTKGPGPNGLFSRFHASIQTRERPSRFYAEIAWLIGVSWLLVKLWP